ncbi:cold shock domain-containing protein [Shewanella sp. MM_2022_3]|uniref:cold-shock protein n=1 Tax=Shewanella sp. MM_2022_3 TaxID=2923280 RepID=UPI001F4BF3B4|nr:cold shock domain-containing protein [Shewanella sp. MM_2022_3]MCH7424247.1 cold shock domain-containing protein [Shewanella sp. MM_2022_3]
MKGKVVSYLATKKYGFIQGDDGESYFLHFSELLNRKDEDKLVKGSIVNFDPTPTPKGLAAKAISLPEVFIKERLVNFFTTRDSRPQNGTVIASFPIATRFFKDPSEGRRHLEQLAKHCGFNAVLNVNFEKDTFSKGNYRYTVHAFKGELALVTEKVPADSQELVIASAQLLEKRKADVELAVKQMSEAENLARQKQLSGCLGSLAMITLIPLALVLSAIAVFPA